MAAVTPSSTTQLSLGSSTGLIAVFANTLDNADTWTTGLTDIVHIVPTQADASGVQAATGCGVSWVASTGVVTFHLAEDNTAVRLLIYRGSTS